MKISSIKDIINKLKEYGFQPGPALGEILTKIEYAIADGELANEKEAIIAYIQQAKEEEK